jgi:hypothetical protein
MPSELKTSRRIINWYRAQAQVFAEMITETNPLSILAGFLQKKRKKIIVCTNWQKIRPPRVAAGAHPFMTTRR